MKVLLLTLFVIMMASLCHAGSRIWTSYDGRVIQAELITYSQINREVTLKRSDGLIFHVPTKILSWRDIEYLDRLVSGNFNYSRQQAFDPFDNYWDTQEYINHKNWKCAQQKTRYQTQIQSQIRKNNSNISITIKL